MIINSVQLTNFRSHAAHRLDCTERTTLILGPNGSGKTSVLEAIYLAARGKSFRATDKEMIRRQADYYRVELKYSDGRSTIVTFEQPVENFSTGADLKSAQRSGKKTFLYSGKKTARLPKVAKYPVILFEPPDLNLVASSPSRKRTYFDNLISQYQPGYSSALSRYEKALRQRNEALKSPAVSPDLLFSWNVMLARYGVELRTARARLAEVLNQKLTDLYRQIAKNDDEVSLNYLSATDQVDESGYLHLLDLDYDRDRFTGHTNFGAHKDDYTFIFNRVPAAGSASRGETRSIILSLKFLEAEILETELKKRPLILLDDVFSELDDTRRQSLIHNFSFHQIILTSTNEVDLR